MQTILSEVGLYKSNDCGTLLKYNGIPVKVSYIEYQNQGRTYPAYCLDKNKVGAETINYNVSITDYINDVKLWRIITNGYPYKTIEELGLQNREEAFTATKQAVYCYIHGNDINLYEGIGEEGIRTLNALKKILSDAQVSNEVKLSSEIKVISEESEWKIDDIDNNYLSKTYGFLKEENVEEIKLTLETCGIFEIDEIKITDLKNIEKSDFFVGDQFKVLIPISKLIKEGEFKIKAEGKVLTKPVLFGKAPDSNYQDYAIVVSPYEEENGEYIDSYEENKTKIIINKKDKKTHGSIEGVEFEILDSNKNIKYSGLKTDKNGQIIINNVVPGIYYLKETVAGREYDISKDLIEINVSYQEEYSIDVYNEKKEKKVDIIKEKKEIKRLPVTGM